MKKLVEKSFFFSSLILSCEAWNILKLEKQKGNLMVFFKVEGFPGGSVAKNPPANAGDTSSILIWEDPTCHRAMEPMCHND